MAYCQHARLDHLFRELTVGQRHPRRRAAVLPSQPVVGLFQFSAAHCLGGVLPAMAVAVLAC